MNNVNTTTSIQFPVLALRRIENPLDKEGKTIYIAITNIQNLPQVLNEWRSINPRDPNPHSGVSKKIRNSLTEDPKNFVFKNRGITILADGINFNNATNSLELRFKDKDIHGLLDGGHTFEVLQNHLTELDDDEKSNAYVKIEILTGFENIDDAVNIVEARNTSMQVKDQSIEELRGSFEKIKQALSKEKYASRIAYKENELTEEGTKKDIDIKDILSYLTCFDIESFDNEAHPIKAYSSKKAVVDHFVNNKGKLEKYTNILPDILRLRDEIYKSLPDAYNQSKEDGKFGKLLGVKYTENKKRFKDIELCFTDKTSGYRIPDAFIYPILASFRNLIKIEDGKAGWKTDPFKFFDSHKIELGRRVGERALQIANPTKMGKDSSTWQSCYDAIRLAYFEHTNK